MPTKKQMKVMSCSRMASSRTTGGKRSGNHITTPLTSSPSAPRVTAQKNTFCPGLYFPPPGRLFVVAMFRHQLRRPPRALLVGTEMHVPEPVEELQHRHEEEEHAGVRMDDARDLEPADERRHPAEERRPDRHAGDEGEKERERDRPVNEARGAPVADDLALDDDVLAVPRHDDGSLGDAATHRISPRRLPSARTSCSGRTPRRWRGTRRSRRRAAGSASRRARRSARADRPGARTTPAC